MAYLDIIGALIVLVGAVFLVLAAVGVLRMPDPYNRIQAGTKASTLGVVLALAGLGIYEPAWLPKLLVIALFVLITNPVSSHALARAAHNAGVPLTPETVRDEMVSEPEEETVASEGDPDAEPEEAQA